MCVGKPTFHCRRPSSIAISKRSRAFVRNHAHAVVVCDFFTTATVRFRIL